MIGGVRWTAEKTGLDGRDRVEVVTAREAAQGADLRVPNR